MKKKRNLDSKSPYKPKDRAGGFPSSITYTQRRFFEILPGVFVWLLLLLPIIFALLRWSTPIVVYITFYSVYWFYRTAKFVIASFIGVKRMKSDLKEDWVEKIKVLNSNKFKNLRYIYLTPVYGESLEVLIPSFEAWSKSDIGAKRIDVVFAMEERKKDLQLENFKKLKEKYGKKFGSMRYYIHPANIPGEIVGVKGGNINWAARHLVEDLEKEGKNLKEYLLITCDSDLRPNPKYLSAVTYKYLTTSEPENTFFASAVHSFNNNIWNVPPIIRTQSNMLTLVTMHLWVVDKKRKTPFSKEIVHTKDTFSSYIVNLNTLREIKFWDPEIPNDDTAFYWNTIVRSKGNFKGEEVYIPTYNDAVENETFLKTHISFYKQQYRWGWGIYTFPISLAAMMEDKDEFPFSKKMALLKIMFDYLSILTVVFTLAFGLRITGWLNPTYQYTAFSYNLPKILSILFSIVVMSNIPIIIFRRQITPVPKEWKWWRHITDFLETYLITVNMLTFGFIPYIQAITEMMLGKAGFKRNFYVTEKVKIEKKKV